MLEELGSKLFWTTWLSSFTIEFAVMFSKMSHGVVGVLRYRVVHSYWSRSVEILSSDWLNLTILSMP